jgi:raffinose/stachyose/melibiose transport system substrate-binding protein
MKAIRLLVLLLTLSLFLSVAPVRSQQTITLHIMHWTDSMVKGTAWWDKIVSGFEAAHPGVTVESNFVAFAQYLPTLTSMSAGAQLPDVFFGHVMAAELGRAGLAVNYKDVFDDAFFKRFYPGPLRQFTFDKGAVYALPWTAQIFGIFSNDKIMKDLGLKVPDTWDQLIEMAPKIKQAGYVPVVWGNKARNVCPDFFLPLVTQNGGDVYALDDLTDPKVSWDSEPVKKALTLLDKLTKAGVFVDGINGIDEQQGQQIAYQGKAAMLYTGSWMPATIDAQAPEDFVKNYSVHKVPALTVDGVHWTGDGSGEGWVVSAKSPNKDLAVEFVKYLLSDEVYPIHIEGAQNMPSMPSALDKVKHPMVREMTGWLTTDGSDHILFGQGSWDAVANVCQGILDGSITPEAGAAKIQSDVMATRGHK